MCRLLAYKSPPVILDDLLYEPEHIFALFLEHLASHADKPNLSTYRDALMATLDDIIELKNSYGLNEASTLNLLITDGRRFAGSRFVAGSGKEPLSLYFA